MSNGQRSSESSYSTTGEHLDNKPPFIINPDRTITRVYQMPSTPAAPDRDSSSSPVLSKDVALNPQHSTFVRLFLPRQHALDGNSSKLPLIVYFHGGGFILYSAASTIVHNFCVEIAVQVGVMIVSVDYRLAPEHRLPAAYDDAMEALHWIRTSRDEWLLQFADFSTCFLMGDSAGGNIAYHTGLCVAASADQDHLAPLKIRGLILHEPGFGGCERTGSELRLINDPHLPQFVADLVWELSLPIGADRDHEYCNPTAESGGGNSWERLRSLGWRVMVTGCNGDPIIDRQMELVKVLEEQGVQVAARFDVGDRHGALVKNPNKAKDFFGFYKILCICRQKSRKSEVGLECDLGTFLSTVRVYAHAMRYHSHF